MEVKKSSSTVVNSQTTPIRPSSCAVSLQQPYKYHPRLLLLDTSTTPSLLVQLQADGHRAITWSCRSPGMALTTIKTTSCILIIQFIVRSLDQDRPMDTVETSSFQVKDSDRKPIQSADSIILNTILYQSRLPKSGVQCLQLKPALPSSEM